jgi:hypothetical protein
MTAHRCRSDGIPSTAGFPMDGQRQWPRATASAASSGVKWLSSASASNLSAQRPSLSPAMTNVPAAVEWTKNRGMDALPNVKICPGSQRHLNGSLPKFSQAVGCSRNDSVRVTRAGP